MPKVTAWMCPHTKKLFLDQAEYKSHLAKLARHRAWERREEKIRQEKASVFERIRNAANNFDELEQLVLENQEYFIRNGREHDWAGRKSHPDLKLIGIKFKGMRWCDVSNSHDCPLAGGVTNWGGRNKDAPRSYPGWQGNIWIAFNHEPQCWGSDIFQGTGIFPGTGGYAGKLKDQPTSYCLEWDVSLFAADFDGLQKQVVIDILKA